MNNIISKAKVYLIDTLGFAVRNSSIELEKARAKADDKILELCFWCFFLLAITLTGGLWGLIIPFCLYSFFEVLREGKKVMELTQRKNELIKEYEIVSSLIRKAVADEAKIKLRGDFLA